MRARLLRWQEVTPAVEDAWRALAASAAEANPFYEPTAVLEGAGLLAGAQELTLLAVQDEDGPDLHLVLPVLRGQRFRRVPVPALLGWQHAYCYLGTPLVRPGREHEAWGEVLDLGKEPAVETWLVLPQLPLQGASAVALQDVLAARYARSAALDLFGRPVLRRRPTPSYLDGRLSPRHHKSLRRQARRLAEQLGAPLEVADVCAGGPGADVDGALREFMAMEAAGWKGRAGTAIASREADVEWFHRFAGPLHEQGRLQLWALRSGDRVAAWQCNVVAGDTVFHVRICHDEALARCSPGLQLESAQVEQFHRDTRLRRLDSCVDEHNRVSAQLYPDREVLGTLLVPLRPVRGTAAISAARAVTRLRIGLTAARRHRWTAPEPVRTPQEQR